MMRQIIFMIILSSTIFAVIGVIKPFNYSCNLQKHADLDAATFPSFSNIKSLRFKISHRVTHELTTRVLAIFLREILDFDKPIELDTYEEDRWTYVKNLPEDKYQEYYVMDDLSKTSSSMIDLEVWRTADNRESNINNVWEANSLSINDVFRFGLYVPEALVLNRKITFKNFIADGRFRDGSYEASKEIFDLSREIFITKLARYTENITNGDVKNGIYDPHRCASSAEPCAIILTSHFFDTIFFTRVVDALKMKVKIYFLGDNLKRKIKDFSDAITNNRSKKIFLVLHWTPSEIIDGSVSYSSIDLPKCEELKREDITISCKFDANTVSVFFNDELKKSSPAFESLLYKVRFKSLKTLIKMYDERYLPKIDSKKKIIPSEIILPKDKGQTIDDIYNEIACKYLQNETEYYNPHGDSWLSDDNDITIYVGGIYPNDNSGQEYDGIQASRLIATEEFQSITFDRYKLQIENEQTDCKPDLALKSFIKHFSNREHLIGVLGPPCSEAIEPIAIISKHYKMSAITYSAEGISFADRSNYPYFFRTIGENSQYEDVFAKLFPHLNWERIAAITEDGQKYTEYISRMESNNNTFKIIVNRKFPRETNEKKQLEHFEKLLKDLKETNRARIIICDIHDHLLMKPIMCMASKLKMTINEGFVWFLPVYISLKLNETTLLHTNETCTAAELREILKGHFALAHANFGNDTDIIPMNYTVGEWKEKYIQKRGISAISWSDYAPFVYDTIWVYAKALKALINADSPENETTKHWYMKNLDKEKTLIKLSEIIGNMSFTGVTGRIEFNKAGSRYTIINILQWQNNDFTLVGTYKPIIINKESNDGELVWNEEMVKWPSKEIPDDGREKCLFKFLADALSTECHTINTVLIAILCVLIILACSGFSFLFWKQKYAKKLEESAQIMTNYGLVVNGIELSRWEIQRENVIINRRIGEGAFGTVYGGEALVKESEGWMPVAIKTLKAGAIADARLDFLGESETMKRFDHKNIVKLIAVCLQKEPLFMLSEFMLYGDLKTFLLARRHLVDDKINDDNNDISPKRLTLMALDIARGLSYLASLNFVHRDLACRNCLINAQRICKIGDFGMARSTCENEYYRFTRKGMLPVRWMSPESIATGRFSHSSDVWAYAVFLYEVVTLGAFPFQGLNNNQVFDFVKAGGCVKIPSKCKPPLRALMSSCFSIDTKKRPGASEIVEFISTHPKMLTVCMMDAPKPNLDEQVNLLEGNNEDLEFDQLAETRERSHTPAATINVDFLRTSSSSSALQIQNRNQEFDYLDMKLPRRLNGFSHQTPDLTATLPNGNYNPIEPLLQPRSEISKSTLSLLKMYVPMCGKNRNRSSTEECTTPI